MKRFSLIIFTVIFLIGCSNPTTLKDEKTKNTEIVLAKENNKVIGLGGIFFKCKDPQMVKEWFDQNIGLITNEYGSMFEFRLINNPEEIGYLQWSPFSEKTNYFQPSEKELMINYRVKNLKKLMNELKENNVTILDSIESYEYGKFLHIMDPENNKIELWEPIDSVFTNLYEGKTTIKVGIGGIFFKSKNPKKLIEWYHNNLGFVTDKYGSVFKSRNAVNPDEINRLQWSPFSDSTEYFSPSEKQFMINYRVENLEELVSKLRSKGITILDSIEDTPYGKFVHAMAPENIKIELWEPILKAQMDVD